MSKKSQRADFLQWRSADSFLLWGRSETVRVWDVSANAVQDWAVSIPSKVLVDQQIDPLLQKQ